MWVGQERGLSRLGKDLEATEAAGLWQLVQVTETGGETKEEDEEEVLDVLVDGLILSSWMMMMTTTTSNDTVVERKHRKDHVGRLDIRP